MATGFLEFLLRLQATDDEGRPPYERVWADFVALAGRTSGETKEALDLAVELSTDKEPFYRAFLAVIVAKLLKNVEWPIEAEACRSQLVERMSTIRRECDPSDASSLAGLLPLEPLERELWVAQQETLALAIELFRRCRRDEVVYVGVLVTNALKTFFSLAKIALAANRAGRDPAGLGDARTRFVVAHSNYAQAARELHGALGLVIFDSLDARLGAQP